jgi:hypothetical protein
MVTLFINKKIFDFRYLKQNLCVNLIDITFIENGLVIFVSIKHKLATAYLRPEGYGQMRPKDKVLPADL